MILVKNGKLKIESEFKKEIKRQIVLTTRIINWSTLGVADT